MTTTPQPLRAQAPGALAVGGLARWSCNGCGKPVDLFTTNHSGIWSRRFQAERHDTWAACSNPQCHHSYGGGVDGTQAPTWTQQG